MKTNIEPGVLCMVTDPGAFGAITRAVRPICKDEAYLVGDCRWWANFDGWLVDPPVQVKGYMEPDEVFAERHLRRIDGYESEQQERRDAVEA